MIVVVDNYDSFTFNLVQAIGALDQEIVVIRNDSVSAGDVAAMAPSGLVISPGPGTPADAGCSVDVVRELGSHVPLLGVCLGHQAIAAAFGGEVQRAPAVVHGKTAAIEHDGRGLFHGLDVPFVAARYHSLAVVADSLPAELEVTARAGDVVMGLQHRDLPIHGVQFHPESIATPGGVELLANFVAMTRDSETHDA